MLKVVDGEEIEKRVVEYFQGAGTMLPGIEAIIDGLETGDKKTGVLEAKKAFGDPVHQIEKKIARAEFPKDAELSVGTQFAANLPDNGGEVVMRVEKLTDDEVTVAMIPAAIAKLADKDIEYELEILAVSKPAAPPPLPADAIGASEAE